MARRREGVMCKLDCPHLACRTFTAKSEKWSGFCFLQKKLVKDINSHMCDVAIQQDLFNF